jgi:hypothetical protein
MRAFTYVLPAVLFSALAVAQAAPGPSDSDCKAYGKESVKEDNWYHCHIPSDTPNTGNNTAEGIKLNIKLNGAKLNGPKLNGVTLNRRDIETQSLGKSAGLGVCCSPQAKCGLTSTGLSGCYVEKTGQYYLADDTNGVALNKTDLFVKFEDSEDKGSSAVRTAISISGMGAAAIAAVALLL